MTVVWLMTVLTGFDRERRESVAGRWRSMPSDKKKAHPVSAGDGAVWIK